MSFAISIIGCIFGWRVNSGYSNRVSGECQPGLFIGLITGLLIGLNPGRPQENVQYERVAGIADTVQRELGMLPQQANLRRLHRRGKSRK